MNKEMMQKFDQLLLRKPMSMIKLDENGELVGHLCTCVPYCNRPERSKREDNNEEGCHTQKHCGYSCYKCCECGKSL